MKKSVPEEDVAGGSNGSAQRERRGTDRVNPDAASVSARHPATTRDIDRLSLNQALLDFEVANARTIDLTQRLLEAARENQDLRNQLAAATSTETGWTDRHAAVAEELAALRATYDQFLASRTYKLMKAVRALRRALNV